MLYSTLVYSYGEINSLTNLECLSVSGSMLESEQCFCPNNTEFQIVDGIDEMYCSNNKVYSYEFPLHKSKNINLKRFKNCTEDNISQLNHVTGEIELFINRINSKIEYVFDEIDLTSSAKSNLTKASNVLNCMRDKIREIKFSCNDKSSFCRRGGVMAYVMGRSWSNKIRFCPSSHKSNDTTLMLSTVVHELSHTCGTNDSTYFSQGQIYSTTKTNWRSFFNGNLDELGGEKWPYIADTYSMWALHGFCFPESKDTILKCRKKRHRKEYPKYQFKLSEKDKKRIEELKNLLSNGEITQADYDDLVKGIITVNNL